MKLLVICRRELSAYFGSVVAYVLLAVFLVLSGYFFYSDLVFFILFGGFTLATGLWQFVFLDMREDRVNWGNFMMDMRGFPNDPSQYAFTTDYPGMYHNGGCGFSFADGHAETKRCVYLSHT